MASYQRPIGRERAIALNKSKWWLQRSPREIAKFQLFTAELCMPFSVFHRAVEEALGRQVWLHEFGRDADGLVHELIGERDPPTLDEIMRLVPEEKRKVIRIDDASEHEIEDLGQQ
jgi:hypothetical protein